MCIFGTYKDRCIHVSARIVLGERVSGFEIEENRVMIDYVLADSVA